MAFGTLAGELLMGSQPVGFVLTKCTVAEHGFKVRIFCNHVLKDSTIGFMRVGNVVRVPQLGPHTLPRNVSSVGGGVCPVEPFRLDFLRGRA